MAKTAAPPKKKPAKVEQPESETPPEPTADAEEHSDTTIETEPAERTATPTFFQTMQRIPAADWGARANIYLYRIEPVIDRTRSGGPKFVEVYAEPVNESRIMADHGSGRYKLVLNFHKPGNKKGDEIDSVYFQIYNLKYPPKIAPGEWVDDPKNAKWKMGQTIPGQAQQNGNGSIVEAFQTFTAIEDQLRQRNAPDSPRRSPAEELKTLAEAAKIMNPPAPISLPTIPDYILEEMRDTRKEAAAARAENTQLLLKMIDMAKGTQQSNGMGAVGDVVKSLKELLPEVKELFPSQSQRSRMGPWMEFFAPWGPEALKILQPFAHVLARKMAEAPPAAAAPQAAVSPRTPAQPPPTQQSAPQAQQQPIPEQTPTPTTILEFLNEITPMLFQYLRNWEKTLHEKWDGQSFAVWIADQYGLEWNGLRWHDLANEAGVENLIQAYRQSQFWQSLAPIEGKFRTFIEAFLQWEPSIEESGPATEPSPAGEESF